MLVQMGSVQKAGAITVHQWFRELLLDAGFLHNHDIIMLAWMPRELANIQAHSDVTVRPMNYDDLADVEIIDRHAFFPLWRNSLPGLKTAFKHASLATVAELNGQIVGYQISTSSQMNAHLARLAVDPEYQGQGIGYRLVHDVLQQSFRRGLGQVTVNTQSDNRSSVSLYKKLGFEATGEIFPVYEYPLE